MLDVGCGPGGLCRCASPKSSARRTSRPSIRPAVRARPQARLATADVRVAAAEELPFEDEFVRRRRLRSSSSTSLTDPERGVGEMKRVVKPGGSVAACTWDYRDGMTMLRAYWEAGPTRSRPTRARSSTRGRTARFATREELTGLWRAVSLDEVEGGEFSVDRRVRGLRRPHGPRSRAASARAGAFCASLDPKRQQALRAARLDGLGDPKGPFEPGASLVRRRPRVATEPT